MLGNGNNYYITIKDIHDGKIIITDKTDRVDDDAIAIIKKRSRIKNGDILFTSIGRVGETAIVTNKDDSWDVNESVFVFTINPDIIIAEYFCLLFQSKDIRERLTKDSTGSTFKSIKMNQLERMTFDIPPIEQQRKLVSKANVLKAIIKDRNSQLTQLDLLVKARFVEMFGEPENNNLKWEICKLGELCNVSSSKRIYQNEQTSCGVPFLRISDLVTKMDTGTINPELFIAEEKFQKLSRLNLVPKNGDILLTARGTLGRCYIVNKNDKFYFQDGMITWLSDFNCKITPIYISYLFTMSGFRKQIDSLQAGSTVAYLSIAMTKKLDIMLPPIELQNKFAAFVEQIDKSKVAVQKALDEAQTLFDSLMQEYFG